MLIKMTNTLVSSFMVIFVSLNLSLKETEAVILTPCKVQNMVTQPKYGTSLKTKSLVNIVQIPPVFVQNVMVGICENRNQNYSTGKPGELYSCQQRYSAVEIYTAEASSPASGNPYQAGYNDISYVRETVIIESGCDFVFNLLPLIADMRRPGDNNQGNYVPPQQNTYLRSPFYPNIPGVRQPSTPVAVYPQNSQPYTSDPVYQMGSQSSYPAPTQGRAVVIDEDGNLIDDGTQDDDAETKDQSGGTKFTIL